LQLLIDFITFQLRVLLSLQARFIVFGCIASKVQDIFTFVAGLFHL